jgi:hypothetical protein
MADGSGGSIGGIGLGGILVIVGIVLAFTWSLWAGIIIALIGLQRACTPVTRPRRQVRRPEGGRMQAKGLDAAPRGNATSRQRVGGRT